jgi:hypothetical protein
MIPRAMPWAFVARPVGAVHLDRPWKTQHPKRRRVSETPRNRQSNFIADAPNRIFQQAANIRSLTDGARHTAFIEPVGTRRLPPEYDRWCDSDTTAKQAAAGPTRPVPNVRRNEPVPSAMDRSHRSVRFRNGPRFASDDCEPNRHSFRRCAADLFAYTRRSSGPSLGSNRRNRFESRRLQHRCVHEELGACDHES